MPSCFSGCFKTSAASRSHRAQPAECAAWADPRQALLATAPHSAFRPPEGPRVASIIVPGTEDPRLTVARGGLQLKWRSEDTDVTVRNFTPHCMERLIDPSLALPTLYLHFLDKDFFPDFPVDWAVRAGNDNEEVRISLPPGYSKPYYISGQRIRGDLGKQLAKVLRFLTSVGEVPVSSAEKLPGMFGPQSNWAVSTNRHRLTFSLKAARPKASISLDKAAFGIPFNADLYLFAMNHDSVMYMSDEYRDAFEACIQGLPAHGKDLKNLATFLKVFYEGGFAYNRKINLSGGSYLPENVGVACIDTVPAFAGQVGISTGYPYLLDSRFLPFIDTAPVTIRAISGMSARHKRYGLCFTRNVFVWEGPTFDDDLSLEFCAIAPHGGFYYVPRTLGEYWDMGALLYAFGEDRDSDAQQHSNVGSTVAFA